LVGKQPPLRADVDLNHLVREVCSFVEFETHRMDLGIELALGARPILVNVDLVQIEQVLLNLVRNGLDALQEAPEDRRRLTITTHVEDARALVTVQDTGAGISSDRLLRLFHPFFTTKEGGMGMGLAISQTIVENHDGRIWAESEPGQGAAFHVSLPLAAAEPSRGEAGAAHTAPLETTT
jgi:C4-dicarboxylate-specific signal transduction histidine kinase